MPIEPGARKGMVYLVGAGPGDPGLLTVRALELLRAADVVAYDALVSPAILSLVGAQAELLPVGRRHGAGVTSYRLHPEVLARAKAGHTVVRLKAGDPLIFGRGGEEAEELANRHSLYDRPGHFRGPWRRRLCRYSAHSSPALVRCDLHEWPRC